MTTIPLLLSVALKGLVVLGLAALATHLLRKAPASARHGVWAAAFGALLLLPVLEAVGPSWTVSVLPASAPPAVMVPLAPPAPPVPPAPPAPPAPAIAQAPEADGAALAAFEAEVAAFEAEMEGFAAEMEGFAAEVEALEADRAALDAERALLALAPLPPPRTGTSPIAWVLGAWALGAIVVGLGWLVAFLSARRLVGLARPEADEEWAVLAERARRLSGLPEGVRLLRSDEIEVPIAWGFGRPAVVLPASADEWSDDRREAVLLHEMAHLRRRDAWTQVLAQAALTLHWPNPFAWMGYRHFLDAREQACDDAVLQGGARPSAYAEHLVGVARSLRRDRIALAAVAPMARQVPLESRVRSILEVGRRRGQLGRPALGGTVGLALLVIVPLAALRPVATAQEAPAAPAALADTDLDVDLDLDADVAPDVDLDLDAEIEEAIEAEIEAAAAEVEAALSTVGEARAEIEAAAAPALPEVILEMDRAEADLSSHRDVIESWRRRRAEFGEAEWLRVLRNVEATVADTEACTAEALAALKRVGLDEEALVALRTAVEEAQDEIDAARVFIVDSESQTQAALSVSTLTIRAIERDAARAASEARRDALRRVGKPTAPPGVRATPPAPRPGAAPRLGVRRAPAAEPFDWDAVDRARAAALRTS